jgi:uncharacterized phiE125 gp8 family phage protein
VNYGLIVTSAAAATDLPIKVEEVADYLRTDSDNDSELAHISNLLAQALEEIERYTGRSIAPTQYRLVLEDWPRGPSEFASYPRAPQGAYLHAIELPRAPVTAVATVKYYPENSEVLTTLSSTQYFSITSKEPGLVYLKSDKEWPVISERPDAVQVEFTAGYTAGNCPASMKQAALLLARFYYAGGSPNDVDQGGNDLEKAHMLLNKYKLTGWSA